MRGAGARLSGKGDGIVLRLAKYRVLDRHTRVMRALKQARATREKWRDPMSIYGPDPIRVQAVNWNAGLRESQRDLKACVSEIKAEMAKFRGGSCGAVTSSGSVSGSEGTGTGLGGGLP